MPCPICGNTLPYPMPLCQFCGSPLYPAVPVAPKPVRGIAKAAAVLLGVDAAMALAVLPLRGKTYTPLPVVAVLADLLILATVPVFIVWFTRIRHNAGMWGHQRRSPGWAIGAWFTPGVNLWFPYQIAADAADQFEAEPGGRGTLRLVRGWWAAWILAWVTGFRTYRTTSMLPDGSTGEVTQFTMSIGGTQLSCVVTAIAAVLGLLMVRRLSATQEARIATMATGAYFQPMPPMPPMPPGPPAPPFVVG